MTTNTFVQSELPLVFAIAITLLFTIGFTRFINKKLSNKEINSDRCSIICTIAFLWCYILYFIALLLISNPPHSYYATTHCVIFLITRSCAFNATLYFSQLFYVIRIKTILGKLLNSKKQRYFPVFLFIFLHIVFIVNYFFTFYIIVEQYPNMSMNNVCVVLSSSGIRPLMNGIYQLLILCTFIFIISNILCSKKRHSKRLTRTIIAGIFISVRFFTFPLYPIMDSSYRNWIICASDIFACIAVLSDYYNYHQASAPQTTKQIDPQQKKSEQIALSKNNKPEHTEISVVNSTASTLKSTEAKSTFSALDNTFINAIDNGFTGKEVPPKMCQIAHKFWTLHYLNLRVETRHKLDHNIHKKLASSIKLPHGRYKDKPFGYLSHLHKLMVNLLRVDVSLELELRKSWGSLHSALNISADDCELALDAINEVLFAEFGDLYGIDIEYSFSRVYRTAVSLMLSYYDHKWLKTILDLDLSEKMAISKSLSACIHHEIGREIIWKYLHHKAPHIYIYHVLFEKYNNCEPHKKRNVLMEIQRLCLSAHEVFTIAADERWKNQFVAALRLLDGMDSINVDSFKEMDEILTTIHDIQMDIIEKSLWKTFALFIF